MEVIFGDNGGILVCDITSHYLLGFFSPFVTLEASRHVGVDQGRIVAWRFQVVAAFQDHGVDQWSEDGFTVLHKGVEGMCFASGVSHEGDHDLCAHLVSRGFVNFWFKISVDNCAWEH